MRQMIAVLILILMVCITILIPMERPPAEYDCIISMSQGRMVIIKQSEDE